MGIWGLKGSLGCDLMVTRSFWIIGGANILRVVNQRLVFVGLCREATHSR